MWLGLKLVREDLRVVGLVNSSIVEVVKFVLLQDSEVVLGVLDVCSRKGLEEKPVLHLGVGRLAFLLSRPLLLLLPQKMEMVPWPRRPRELDPLTLVSLKVFFRQRQLFCLLLLPFFVITTSIYPARCMIFLRLLFSLVQDHYHLLLPELIVIVIRIFFHQGKTFLARAVLLGCAVL